MGKKAGKKRIDPEKKAALQAKKEAKAQKSLQKRLQKERGQGDQDHDDNSDVEGEESLDAILLEHKQQQEQSIETPKLEVMDDFPAARANATLTLVPAESKKNKDALYLFGGEYFNGVENVVLDHLYRCELVPSASNNSAAGVACTWKRILTPSPRPAPRCAHGAAYYNGGLYVFGGEILRSDGISYHHYKDLWRLDVATLTWRELKAPTKIKQLGAGGSSSSHGSSLYPSPRSGAVVTIYKSYLIVFGGFYETASRAVAVWYNDVYIMNLQTEEWIEIPHSKFTARPEPRSACQFGIMQVGSSNSDQAKDVMLIHGGFSKLPKSATDNSSNDVSGAGGFASGGGSRGTSAMAETRVHTDSWVLHLDPLQSGKPPVWERWTSSVKASALQHQTGPVGRAAMGSAIYKNRLVVCGGVMDKELFQHKVESIFFNTLHAMDIDRRKWFPMSANTTLKKKRDENASQRSTQVPTQIDASDANDADDNVDNLEDDEGEADPETQAGWDLDKLRSNMFAFIDGSGKVVYEKLDENGNPAQSRKADEEKEEEKEEESDDESEEEKEESKDDATPKRPSKVATSNEPESAKIAASSVMALNSETKLPEAVIRQDPLPRIKPLLIVQGHVLYVYGGLLEVGDREVTLDDMWSLDLRKRVWKCIWAGAMHKQVWLGAAHDDDDSYYSTEKMTGEEDDDDDDDDFDDDDLDDKTDRAKAKPERAKTPEEEMTALEAQYGLDDPNRVPQPGEVVADYFSRTSSYWNDKASKSADNPDVSAKELKRQAFSLAKDHFAALQPVIARLQELGLAIKKARRKAKKEKKDAK